MHLVALKRLDEFSIHIPKIDLVKGSSGDLRWMLLNESRYAFAGTAVALSVLDERIVMKICGVSK